MTTSPSRSKSGRTLMCLRRWSNEDSFAVAAGSFADVTALDLASALRAAAAADPASVPDVLRQLATDIGATDIVVSLVDFSQQTLEPVPDRGTHADAPSSEQVTS